MTKTIKCISEIILIISANFFSAASLANVTYAYTGNTLSPFYTSPGYSYPAETNIDFQFTVSSLIAGSTINQSSILDWNATINGTTINASNGQIANWAPVTTDASGNVVSYPEIMVWGDGVAATSGLNLSFIISNPPQAYGGVGTPFGIFTDYLVVGYDQFGTLRSSFGASSQGTWIVTTSAVPLPSTAWLLYSGLLGLVGVASRKAA